MKRVGIVPQKDGSVRLHKHTQIYAEEKLYFHSWPGVNMISQFTVIHDRHSALELKHPTIKRPVDSNFDRSRRCNSSGSCASQYVVLDAYVSPKPQISNQISWPK